jgi:hypothetical protein
MTTAMTRRLTVWTPVTDESAASAIALLRHLDAQTLAVSEWELVLAAGPGTDVAALQRVASHRPNVRVVVGEPDRASADGDWVLVLAPDDRLEPHALSRCADLVSEAGGHDSLTVRVAGARRDTTAAAVVLTRRGAPVEGGAPSADLLVPVSLRRTARPAGGDESTAPLPDVTADVRWVEGVLELHGRASLPTAGALAADIILVGRASGRLRAIAVDAFTVSGDDEDTEPGLLWQVQVPVGADDVDDEFEVWLEVEASDTDDEDGRPAAAAPFLGRVTTAPDVAVDAPAVVDGRLVSVWSDSDGLVIDVGATGRSLLGHLDPRLASVDEDVTGSLLRVTVPELAHRGTGVVEGSLVLDGMPLPARLVIDDEPRVECYLVGSPGRATLEWSFGPGPVTATGCELVTSLTGEFIVATPRPETPSRSAAAPRPHARPRPQATGPVAALRRRLPRGVDPVVAKLSTLPVLRGAYRRATGLR